MEDVVRPRPQCIINVINSNPDQVCIRAVGPLEEGGQREGPRAECTTGHVQVANGENVHAVMWVRDSMTDMVMSPMRPSCACRPLHDDQIRADISLGAESILWLMISG